MLNKDCLFCKIIGGEVKSELLAETKYSLAFSDINPQAPVHILVIPKKHYSGVAEMNDDKELGDLILLAKRLAEEKKLTSGYRLIINEGLDGGQSVFHTHVHLLGNRKMKWPPG